MKIVKMLAVIIALIAALATVVAASPLELYLVKFALGTDIYRLAGSQNWPVYHISGQQALMGNQLSKSDNNAVLESNQIYRGPSENLRWVHLKRNGTLPALKSLYSGSGMLLAESGNVFAAGVKSGRDYIVKSFNLQPMVIAPATIFRTSSLVRDTAVSTLVHLVDTAQVRIRIETMQSFDTRFFDAANHDSVVGWIRNQFLNMGISDVITDTFDMGLGLKQHNIIATIPGLFDTATVYIVGGHYDAYSPDPYNRAPGADDNASGTVAAMEMARVLSLPGNQPNCTVRFIALDAEEYGLYGSEYYAQKAVDEGMNLGCMLNYDMIGYQGNDSTFVLKLYSGSEVYAYMLGQMASWYGRLADTNLVPVYNRYYLSSSDSWEFYIRGFPVTYSEEDNFSTVYHQTNDYINYMNIRYCASIIKSGLGMLATLSNYPQRVNDIAVNCLSDDDKIFIQWKANEASNIAGYNIDYGTSSGSYDKHIFVSGLSDTITNLASGTYYLNVRAVDNTGRQSVMAQEIEVQKPNINTILVVDNDGGALDASGESWTKYIESAVANLGYRYSTIAINQNSTTLLGYFNKYPLIVWNMGPDFDKRLSSDYRVFSQDDNASLMEYLDAGGRLWMMGQSYLWQGNPDTTGHPNLWTDYLRLSSVNGWQNKPCSTLAGVAGDPVGDGFNDSIINYYSRLNNNYYWTGCSYGCQLMPDGAETTAVGFITDNIGGYAGIRSQSDTASGYKFIYTSFPLEAVSTPEQRDILAARIINWLLPEKPDYTPPEAPTGLTAVLQDSQVICSWFQNNESDLAGYRIYRALQASLPYWEKLGSSGISDTSYNDSTVKDGSIYWYVVSAYDSSFPNNESQPSGMVSVAINYTGMTAGAEDLSYLPKESKLYQNSPNPFSQSTLISYQLAKPGFVSMKVYNIAGQAVKILVNGEQPGGSYGVKWDGRDESGKNVSKGVYIYRLQSGDISQTKKMMVLR